MARYCAIKNTPWLSCLGLMVLILACSEPEVYMPAEGVQVDRYTLALSVEPDGPDVDGELSFDLHHPDSLRRIELLAGELDVRTVQVNGVAASFERHGARLEIPLAGDTLSTIDVEYTGSPPEGLYADEYAGGAVIYSDSWPDRAQEWWPALHHPSVPATWTLTLDYPANKKSVATGERVASEEADGRRTSTWELAASTPTYSMAFALGDFESFPTDTLGEVTLEHFVLDDFVQLPGGLQRAEQMIELGNELIGPYDFRAYNSVQVPFPWAGMENAGFAFLQADLYDDPEALEEVLAHEAYHQWFGNRLPIADWRDLWLSEGLTTYFTTVFFEWLDGEHHAREKRVEMSELSPENARDHQVMVPATVNDPWEHLTWVPYRKGGSVAHLMRLKAGDEAFFNAIRQLYQQEAGTPQSTERFRELMQEFTYVDFKAIFDVWVYGDELPALRYEWNGGANTLQWSVEGDRNVLAHMPWELQLCQQTGCIYVDGSRGQAELEGNDRPQVRPVGVMLEVQ